MARNQLMEKSGSGVQLYACELPDSCPPVDAFTPRGLKLFRALKGDEPNSGDFLSHRELFTEKKFDNECLSRGLSLFDTPGGIEKILKLPRYRNGTIGELLLESDCGLVKATGNKGHFTWWRFATYDAVANCKVENSAVETL